ncbi:MAG: carboxypeptidase-like regulatory domain-containing protein [Pricia sp.]
MSKNLLFVLYLTLVFHIPHSFAQGADTTEPLGKVLSVLQERFKVQFNYASSLVDPVTVTPPEESLSLEEWVAYLSEESDLKFVFVSDKIISISKKKIRLCGYIKDKDSGETLPYVTVQFGKKGSIADEDGFFEIEVASLNENIAISHIGHKTLERDARYFKEDGCGTLYLVPNHVQLTEIVLYDYLIRGVDKLDDGSLEINFDKFSILPGLIDKDVLHSVQALPGIQSIDETVSNINIRGASNDQNLISWDGIKMYQSGHFFGLISMYNPHITKKVELRKNGSSASETDGVSGTIAMKTEERINTDFKSEVGANFIDANAFVDVPLGERASVQVAARKAISDFVSTPTYSEYFDRIAQDTELEQNMAAVRNSDMAFDFYDTSFRLLYHPSEKDRLRANFI